MKVIFLDHQGVMYLKKHPNVGRLDNFDLGAIDVLNEIIKETDVEIVISSDWKLWVKLEEMKRFFLKQGIKEPIDYTPKYENYALSKLAKQRSVEIIGWLNKNKNVTKWVAIDDLDMRIHLSNFVWVEENGEGIKQKGLKEKILNYIN